VAGAVLAGGRSRRMGSDKGLLRIGSRRLIDVVLETIRRLFPEVLVVANDPTAYEGLGVPVVPDRIPEIGPWAAFTPHSARATLHTPSASPATCPC